MTKTEFMERIEDNLTTIFKNIRFEIELNLEFNYLLIHILQINTYVFDIHFKFENNTTIFNKYYADCIIDSIKCNVLNYWDSKILNPQKNIIVGGQYE